MSNEQFNANNIIEFGYYVIGGSAIALSTIPISPMAGLMLGSTVGVLAYSNKDYTYIKHSFSTATGYAFGFFFAESTYPYITPENNFLVTDNDYYISCKIGGTIIGAGISLLGKSFFQNENFLDYESLL
jgi:hypothetical protein